MKGLRLVTEYYILHGCLQFPASLLKEFHYKQYTSIYWNQADEIQPIFSLNSLRRALGFFDGLFRKETKIPPADGF